MNAAAKKWVKALRSGKYKQTTGQLADDDKFCCLGVACELAIEEGVINSYRPENGTLPKKVQKWIGLSTCFGDMEGRRKYPDLVEYNDSAQWSFKKIAALIERQPTGLFKK